MSVEFTLSGSTLTVPDWNDVFDEWSAAQEEELFTEPSFHAENDHATLILGVGSVRGVSLRLEDEEVAVRLSALASRVDWRNAYAILRIALERGGGQLEREDGTVLRIDDLTADAARAHAVRDFVFSVGAVKNALEQPETTEHGGDDAAGETDDAENRVQLPIGLFNVSLGSSDLPDVPCTEDDVPALESLLAERVERYASAFHGSTMILAGRARLSTWALIPTLVGAPDLIAVQGLDEPIPLVPLLRELGEQVELVGDDVHFLPEVAEADQPALLERLRPHAVSLEAWIEEHGGPEPDGADGEVDPSVEAWEKAAPIIQLVVAQLLAGEPPPDVIDRLTGEIGMPEEVAEMLVGAVVAGMAELQGPQGEMRSLPDVIGRLAEKGMPRPLALLVIQAVAEVLRGAAEASRDDGDEDDENADDDA